MDCPYVRAPVWLPVRVACTHAGGGAVYGVAEAETNVRWVSSVYYAMVTLMTVGYGCAGLHWWLSRTRTRA